MSTSIQRLCAWSGPLFVLFWIVGFVFLARLLPPPTPMMDGRELVDLLQAHPTQTRLGLILANLGSVLLLPWTAIFTVQLKRIEGVHAPLAYTQLAAGAAGSVFFVFPVMYLQIATFRPERSPESVQLLSDMFWLPFVGVPTYLFLQTVVIAVAILRDSAPIPVLPRWAGYFNAWVALIIIPAFVVVFFKTGPLAWNGLFAWWIPLTIFVIWFAVMARVLLAVVKDQEAEEHRPEPELHAVAVLRQDHQRLVVEVAALRAGLDRVGRTHN